MSEAPTTKVTLNMMLGQLIDAHGNALSLAEYHAEKDGVRFEPLDEKIRIYASMIEMFRTLEFYEEKFRNFYSPLWKARGGRND